MQAWYPLWLDPWSSALSTATELPNDSVAQLVRAWQAICQVAGWVIFSPFSLFLTFLTFLGFDQVKVWLSGLEHVSNWACASCFVLATPPLPAPPFPLSCPFVCHSMVKEPWIFSCSCFHFSVLLWTEEQMGEAWEERYHSVVVYPCVHMCVYVIDYINAYDGFTLL